MPASISNLICHSSRSRLSHLLLPGISHRISLLVNHQQRRFLDLQEYQSKQILHENGVTVQKFKVVKSLEEIRQALYPESCGDLAQSKWSGMKDDISNSKEFVVKAQILAGGRGKGYFRKSGIQGGVKITDSRKNAIRDAEHMLNDYLITKQTKGDGVLVQRVMIAEAVRLKREFYFAIVLDRSYDLGPVMVASPCGGMDIEEVAATNRKAIKRFTMPIDTELDLDTARRMVVAAYEINLTEQDIIDKCARELVKLYELFVKLDATQIEINPLGVTKEREVICVDAKINFDENARFRHEWIDEIEQMNRLETDQRDYEAKKHNLNFIGLDGSIGCLVNGAGLAMATMDIIKLHGGEPANFLDVGGGASVEQVTAALKIINSDTNVRAIFVNIFGGIMRCDIVAQGIIEASKSLGLKLPIVVRLEGTCVNEAKEMIRASQLNITSCDDFDTAAKTVVTMQVPERELEAR